MNRPSKKEIKAALDKLRDAKPGGEQGGDYAAKPLAERKANNRIRKKSV